MRYKKDYTDYLIEKYYSEKKSEKADTINSKDSDEYKKKLYASLDKMDILKDIDYAVDVNIMKVILEADSIKEKQKSFHESLLFAAVCSIIISIMLFITIKFSLFTEVLYFEIVIFFIMPVLIIPFAKLAGTKEE